MCARIKEKKKRRGRQPRHYDTGGPRSATILLMLPADSSDGSVAAANPFTAADVLAILRERGWLAAEPSPEQHRWGARAASRLAGHAADRAALAVLLGWV